MPRKTPPAVRDRIHAMLAAGDDPHTIADATGVHVSTVRGLRATAVPPSGRHRQTAEGRVRLPRECLGCTCTPTCGTDGTGRTIVIACNRREDRCA